MAKQTSNIPDPADDGAFGLLSGLDALLRRIDALQSAPMPTKAPDPPRHIEELVAEHTPLPGVVVRESRRVARGLNFLTGAHLFRVEIDGEAHALVFTDLEKAIVFAIAFRHIQDTDKARFAADMFSRGIGKDILTPVS